MPTIAEEAVARYEEAFPKLQEKIRLLRAENRVLRIDNDGLAERVEALVQANSSLADKVLALGGSIEGRVV